MNHILLHGDKKNIKLKNIEFLFTEDFKSMQRFFPIAIEKVVIDSSGIQTCATLLCCKL